MTFMSEDLKPCPCGKTPKGLNIDMSESKYYSAHGNCCSEWSVVFRSMYLDIDDPRLPPLAFSAWNDSPRGESRIAELEAELEGLKKQSMAKIRQAMVAFNAEEEDWEAGMEILQGLLNSSVSKPVQPAVPDGWISVEERLPEDRGVVLVVDRRFAKTDRHDTANGYGRSRPPGVRFGYICDSGLRTEGTNGECDISHWMPLPAAPKENT